LHLHQGNSGGESEVGRILGRKNEAHATDLLDLFGATVAMPDVAVLEWESFEQGCVGIGIEEMSGNESGGIV
jgi:hypothetical protein